jgi:hypothetical protein
MRRHALTYAVILSIASMTTGRDTRAHSPAGDFDRWFIDETLRVDFHHGGDAAEDREFAALDWAYRQGVWAGSRTRRIDPFEVGRSAVELFDAKTGELLYKKRFDTYFGEYRTTTDALRGVKRVYHETILAPFPKAPVRLLIKVRRRDGREATLLETTIDPASPTISRQGPAGGAVVYDLSVAGDPHAKVDVAIVAEGYTAAEEAKVRADLARYSGLLFAHEPFASLKAKFNVRGVWKPSRETGCDEPGRGVWRETAVGAAFDALGVERYMLTEENKALRDIAVATAAGGSTTSSARSRPTTSGRPIFSSMSSVTASRPWPTNTTHRVSPTTTSTRRALSRPNRTSRLCSTPSA